jgi:acyl-CoA thioester hydrolase
MKVFWLPVRVYLEDTDAQGVVYNASYFRFFERARTDWLRERGVDHGDLGVELGLKLVLVSIEARFIAPGKLGDMLAVSANLQEVKGAAGLFAQEIRRESSAGVLLAEATARVACIDADSGRVRRWPKNILERLNR